MPKLQQFVAEPIEDASHTGALLEPSQQRAVILPLPTAIHARSKSSKLSDAVESLVCNAAGDVGLLSEQVTQHRGCMSKQCLAYSACGTLKA